MTRINRVIIILILLPTRKTKMKLNKAKFTITRKSKRNNKRKKEKARETTIIATTTTTAICNKVYYSHARKCGLVKAVITPVFHLGVYFL